MLNELKIFRDDFVRDGVFYHIDSFNLFVLSDSSYTIAYVVNSIYIVFESEL